MITAITAALLSASLGARIGTKRVYLIGLSASLAAMVLLLVSSFLTGDETLAYALLLLATASLGAGFGFAVPALNTLTAAFNPGTVDRSILGKLDLNPGHLFHRFAYMKTDIPVAGCAHQAGTCRFGTDPATSALNTDCRAHEVDNLYVVDTSVFPSIGAVNPALTAMANSLRVGDHLLERLA